MNFKGKMQLEDPSNWQGNVRQNISTLSTYVWICTCSLFGWLDFTIAVSLEFPQISIFLSVLLFLFFFSSHWHKIKVESRNIISLNLVSSSYTILKKKKKKVSCQG